MPPSLFPCLCPFSVGTGTIPPPPQVQILHKNPWSPPSKCHHHSNGRTMRPQVEGANRLRGDGGGCGTFLVTLNLKDKVAKTLTTPSCWIAAFYSEACSAAGPLMTWLRNQSWPSSWQTEVETRKTHDCGDRSAVQGQVRTTVGNGVWSHLTLASCLQSEFAH